MKKNIMVLRFFYNALTLNLNADLKNQGFNTDPYHPAWEVLVTRPLPTRHSMCQRAL